MIAALIISSLSNIIMGAIIIYLYVSLQKELTNITNITNITNKFTDLYLDINSGWANFYRNLLSEYDFNKKED